MTLKSLLRSLAKKLGIQKTPSLPNSLLTGKQRLRQIERLGKVDITKIVNQEDGFYVSGDPFATFPNPSMSRHTLLKHLHTVLQPRTYFEIGIEFGLSLKLSQAKTIAVDPGFKITEEINCDVRIRKMKSDKFFAQADAFAHFNNIPIDLAFIDGMHLAEFALRDFINAEKHSHQGTVIVFDDMLPRNNLEAYRIRRTVEWAGDVYKILRILDAYRPDLVLVPLNTSPTGTVIVTNLDPTSTVLEDNLDAITTELTSLDPQIVESEILHRTIAINPQLLIDNAALSHLAKLRDSDPDPSKFEHVWKQLRSIPKLETSTGSY